MKISIPIENTANILIGDIFIKCEVKFMPESPNLNTLDATILDMFNSRLKNLGYEIAAKISDELQKSLNSEGKGG